MPELAAIGRMPTWKRWTTGIALALFVIHPGVLYVLVTMNAASPSIWIVVPLLMGPPFALVATAIALYPPVARRLFAINATILAVYVVAWAWPIKVYLLQ
jgi:hypothetical protein